MGKLFRKLSVVLLIVWAIALAIVLVPALVNGVTEALGRLPTTSSSPTVVPLLLAWSWVAVSWLLPASALFHIAGEISVIADGQRGKRAGE